MARTLRASRTDPSSRDWQARFVYTLRNDMWLEDYVCGEPHRDLSSVTGVRRPQGIARILVPILV